MTATGGGGEDRYKDFMSKWNSRPKLTWNPLKIGALPGGSKTIAVLFSWHSNAQGLCGHALRYAGTPLWKIGTVFVLGTGTWLAATQKLMSTASEEQTKQLQLQLKQSEEDATKVRQQMQAEVDKNVQLNRELKQQKDHFANFSSWFRK